MSSLTICGIAGGITFAVPDQFSDRLGYVKIVNRLMFDGTAGPVLAQLVICGVHYDLIDDAFVYLALHRKFERHQPGTGMKFYEFILTKNDAGQITVSDPILQ